MEFSKFLGLPVMQAEESLVVILFLNTAFRLRRYLHVYLLYGRLRQYQIRRFVQQKLANLHLHRLMYWPDAGLALAKCPIHNPACQKLNWHLSLYWFEMN
jgi:hypothetical protein